MAFMRALWLVIEVRRGPRMVTAPVRVEVELPTTEAYLIKFFRARPRYSPIARTLASDIVAVIDSMVSDRRFRTDHDTLTAIATELATHERYKSVRITATDRHARISLRVVRRPVPDPRSEPRSTSPIPPGRGRLLVPKDYTRITEPAPHWDPVPDSCESCGHSYHDNRECGSCECGRWKIGDTIPA